MKRVIVGLLAFGLVIATGLVAAGRSGTTSDASTGAAPRSVIRWDLPQFVGNVVLAGGSDVSTDAKTGDTVELTGSGQAETVEGEAAGGGTFVHMNASGTVLAQGAYQVIDFISWKRLTGGSLSGTGLIDGIGNGTGGHPNEGEETSGVLKLRVRFIPVVSGSPQPGVNGVLIINCHLPGTTVFVQEGVQVKVPSFNLNFTQTSGFTLFHALH